MSATKSVWVIEQGCYSDYRVVGVFTSKADAKLVADAINGKNDNREESYGDDATVAEWPLNPGVADLRKGYRPFLFEILRDGTVERCVPWSVSGYDLGGKVDIWRRSTAPAYRGKNVPDCLHGTVYAKDAQHAIKIANEHRAQFIASGRWK